MAFQARIQLQAPQPAQRASDEEEEQRPLTQAQQHQLTLLLGAASSGRLSQVHAALSTLGMRQSDLMAAMARSLLGGHPHVASLILRHTRQLAMWSPDDGSCGSLGDPDAVLAATVRCFVEDGGLEAAGGWGEWGQEQLARAASRGLCQTASALVGSGVPVDAAQLLPACAGASNWHPRQRLWLPPQLRDQLAGPFHGYPSFVHAALQDPELAFLSPDTICDLASNESLAAADQQGRTALHILAAGLWRGGFPSGRQHWVRRHVAALLAKGASLLAQDAQGRTPLLALCLGLPSDSSKTLLLGSAEAAFATPQAVILPDSGGQTPVAVAAQRGFFGLAADLALYALDDAQLASQGLQLALTHGYADLVATFRLCGVRPAEGALPPPQLTPAVAHALAASPCELLMEYNCRFKSREALMGALERVNASGLAAHLGGGAEAAATRAVLRALLLSVARRMGVVPPGVLDSICICVLLQRHRPNYASLLS